MFDGLDPVRGIRCVNDYCVEKARVAIEARGEVKGATIGGFGPGSVECHGLAVMRWAHGLAGVFGDGQCVVGSATCGANLTSTPLFGKPGGFPLPVEVRQICTCPTFSEVGTLAVVRQVGVFPKVEVLTGLGNKVQGTTVQVARDGASDRNFRLAELLQFLE